MKQKLFLDAAADVIDANNYRLVEKKRAKVSVTKFRVDDDNEKKVKRLKGDYYTISYDNKVLVEHSDRVIRELIKVLNGFFKNYNKSGKTLVIGLGNSSILADALGPITANKIIATNQYDDFLTIPKIALFVPDVIGKTGISSFNLIKMVVNDLKPDTIIIIDSLVTSNKIRLNFTIEVSDAGIIPGSALKNNKEINMSTFNIPVIAIGIPLLLEIDEELYVAPDVKSIIEASSDVISKAINKTLL